MFAEPHAWAPALKFARQILAEHSVWCWVLAQNTVHGVAPSAAQVFGAFERRAVFQTAAPSPGKRTVNKWVARWRLRWGVKRGKLRDVDRVDLDGLRRKARILGAAGGRENLTLAIWGQRFWSHFLAQFFEPPEPVF
eukprot:Skav208604  [mRNA]  locus=scaffold598:383644:384054:+ [translate_table: standard]